MAVFDLDMIKSVYARMPERVAAARKAVGRPLTLAEKILYYRQRIPTALLKRQLLFCRTSSRRGGQRKLTYITKSWNVNFAKNGF